MTKHTALPWDVAEPKVVTGHQKEGNRLVCNRNTKEHICETFQYRNDANADANTSIANANFIVTACNNHYYLLAALENLVSSSKDTLKTHPETECCYVTKQHISDAELIIASAKGET